MYLYTANSHDNTVSAFALNTATGALTPVSGSPFATGAVGGFPFALAMDPSGMFLYTANQGSNNISGFGINSTTGALTPIPGAPFAGVMNPYDLTIVRVRNLESLQQLSEDQLNCAALIDSPLHPA